MIIINEELLNVSRHISFTNFCAQNIFNIYLVYDINNLEIQDKISLLLLNISCKSYNPNKMKV